jgi:hypothetical protein
MSDVESSMKAAAALRRLHSSVRTIPRRHGEISFHHSLVL